MSKMYYFQYLFAMLILTGFSTTALADVNYFTCKLNEDGKTMKITSANVSGEVYLPETCAQDGVTYPVITIGESCFAGNDDITAIHIPKSIIWIDNNAFDNCKNLTKVVIEDGDDAIQIGYSKGLVIDDEMFYGCSSLYEAYIGRNIIIRDGSKDAPFEDTSVKRVVFGPKVTSIPAHLCYDSEATYYEISPSVTYIGEKAFYDGNDNLSSIEKKTIVFNGDETSLTTPLTISSEDNVFTDGIVNLYVDRNIQYSKGYPVIVDLYVSDDMTVAFGPHVTQIPDYFLSDNQSTASSSTSRLKTLDLSGASSLETIGEGAFLNNRATEVVIPARVTSISVDAFYSNYSPEDRKIIFAPRNDAVLNIYNGSKSQFEYVYAVELGRNIVTHDDATDLCLFPVVETLDIDKSVTSLPANLFYSNKQLCYPKSITLHWNNQTELEASPFYGKNAADYFMQTTATIHVPVCTEPMYKADSFWKTFSSIQSSGMTEYDRECSSTFGSLVMPFKMASNEDIQFYNIETYVAGNELKISPTAEVPANTPVIFERLNKNSSSIHVAASDDTYVEPTTMTPVYYSDESKTCSLIGSYYDTQNITGGKSNYYVASDKVWYGEKDFDVKFSRAYIKLDTGIQQTAKYLNFCIADEADDIKAVKDNENENYNENDNYNYNENGNIYNLAGQCLSALQKGQINIINGKKVIVK